MLKIERFLTKNSSKMPSFIKKWLELVNLGKTSWNTRHTCQKWLILTLFWWFLAQNSSEKVLFSLKLSFWQNICPKWLNLDFFPWKWLKFAPFWGNLSIFGKKNVKILFCIWRKVQILDLYVENVLNLDIFHQKSSFWQKKCPKWLCVARKVVKRPKLFLKKF